MRDVDPSIPIISLRTFAQHLDSNLDLWLVRAGAAVVLYLWGARAWSGCSGSVPESRLTRSRAARREIGIRMALGAQAGAVLRMFMRKGSVVDQRCDRAIAFHWSRKTFERDSVRSSRACSPIRIHRRATHSHYRRTYCHMVARETRHAQVDPDPSIARRVNVMIKLKIWNAVIPGEGEVFMSCATSTWRSRGRATSSR
mgnify:CR=1 FL=1